MTLRDHFVRSGGLLFRWRSYLPLVLLPVFVLSVLDEPWPVLGRGAELSWEAACFLLALGGLAIRVWTIGTVPAGTSGRGTRERRAATLNTRGTYSLVRHPLYAGNSVTVLGLACFPRIWYLPVIVLLASLLYHERIAAYEEAFLEKRFGDAFREWAARVPAMWPSPRSYQLAGAVFDWRKVVGREFHGLFAIGASVFVLDVVQESFRAGRLAVEPFWAAVCAATGGVFVLMVVLKRGFGLFRTPGAEPEDRLDHGGDGAATETTGWPRRSPP